VPQAVASTEKPTYPISSVDSAMRLLRMVGEQERVRIADAAKGLGVAGSTAHRLMQMLVYHGFVRQDPDSKAYVAGPSLISLGLHIVRKLDVRNVARPYMEALAADVQETVQLFAFQTERSVLCLDSVETERALRIGSRTGVVLSAAASAAGRAVLSTLPLDEIMELYPSARLPRHEHSTVTLRSELLERLETVRAAGYALQRNESEPGVSAIAAPIRVDRAAASFAVTVAIPSSRLNDDAALRIGAAVTTTASDIANALGL
jgi:IclR family acetate operon transcriptional repressor